MPNDPVPGRFPAPRQVLQMARLELALADPSLDDEELHQFALQLRRRLLELDVDRVEFEAAQSPEGSRSGTAIELGTLACTVAQNPIVIESVVKTVGDWLRGHGRRTVRATIDGDTLELTGASDAEQRLVVDAWLARHKTLA